MEDNRKNILEVKNLHTYFYTDSGVVKSVDGVDFELKEGSTLGIVGESGSGKSVTSLSIMGLLRPLYIGKVPYYTIQKWITTAIEYRCQSYELTAVFYCRNFCFPQCRSPPL